MLIYFAVSLYIIIYKGAMLCARVRVIVRACDPMGSHGAVWGAVGGAMAALWAVAALRGA